MEILVVDDSETVRIRFRKFFEEHGYEIYEAESGFSALEVLRVNKKIKLIISDLNMPEMDGMDFIKCARGIEEFKETPILICTTEVCPSLKTRAKKLGVKAWMQKPLKFGRVLEVLDAFLTA